MAQIIGKRGRRLGKPISYAFNEGTATNVTEQVQLQLTVLTIRLYFLDEADLDNTNHLHDLYARVHEICLRLTIDLFGHQVKKLEATKWKDVIKLDPNVDSDSNLVLSVKYWK